MGQLRPKRFPKKPQESPKRPKMSPKSAPRDPNEAPKRPNRAKMTPKGAPRDPNGPKSHHETFASPIHVSHDLLTPFGFTVLVLKGEASKAVGAKRWPRGTQEGSKIGF